MSNLTKKHCVPCEGGVQPFTPQQIKPLLQEVDAWDLAADYKSISKFFHFKNFSQTMAFVNALGFISVRENHHPDVLFSYNTCRVTYSTHAIGGLSENDFICAAKIDAILKI